MTTQQKAFVNAYLSNGFNATRAAKTAGYAAPRQHGWEIKNHPEVAAAIEKRISDQAMSADEVLVRLGAIARSDIFDVLELEPITKKPIMNLGFAEENGTGNLIKEVGYDENGNLTVKLHDAQAALVQLGRHFKLFTDKQEVGGSISIIREVPEGI